MIFITGKRSAALAHRRAERLPSTEPVIFITGKGWRLGGARRKFADAFNGAGDLHHRKVAEVIRLRALSARPSTEPVIFITGKAWWRR